MSDVLLKMFNRCLRVVFTKAIKLNFRHPPQNFKDSRLKNLVNLNNQVGGIWAINMNIVSNHLFTLFCALLSVIV